MNFLARRRRKYLSELRSLRHAEDDLLTPELRRDFDRVIADLEAAPGTESAAAIVRARREFGRLRLPTRYGSIRNWLDLLAVVGAVAFGIRGLFFQPFRIPTSSMQPTLYGIHYLERGAVPAVDRTAFPVRQVLFSARRAEATVAAPGSLDPDSVRERSSVLTDDVDFVIGGRGYRLPGAQRKVLEYADLEPGRLYRSGEVLADGYLLLGDHLFVERLSLYLSPPRRGDIMVFNTEGLMVNGTALMNQSGYYYVKRLAALPGDTVKITDNQLYVRPAGAAEFSRIQDLEPRFAKLYSGRGGYHGHLSGMGTFPADGGTEYTLPPDHYFMLGDNSAFSLDSRFFGGVPRRNLVGRAWLVFWPFGRRWGRVDTAPPLDIPTGAPRRGTFPSMYRQ